MTAGTTPITIQSNHILRVAELLDYLSDTAEDAESSLDGDELAEHQRERMSARHWARELRDAVARQKTVNINPLVIENPNKET